MRFCPHGNENEHAQLAVLARGFIQKTMVRASCPRELSWGAPIALLALSFACSPDEATNPDGSGQTSPLSSSTTSAESSSSSSSQAATGSDAPTSGSGGSGGAQATSASDAAGGSDSAGGSGGSRAVSAANGGAGGAPATDGTTGSGATGGRASLGHLTLYYLDVTEDQVMALDAEGGPPEVLVEGEGEGPDGIAVDAEAGHLYWTNMGNPAEDDGFILRSNVDGSDVTTIVEPGDTFTPKQIKIDAEAGKLYWGDREGMQVMRSNLDGSELEALLTIAEGDAARADRTNHAVGVAVDPSGGYFYWIQKGPPNGGQGSIRRAQLEMPSGEDDRTRTDIEVLYAGLPEPIDLDVDVEAGMMYWTDRGDSTINRAPIEVPNGQSATTRQDRQILVDGVDTAIGVWLDLPAGHVYYTGTDVVGRVDLSGDNNTVLVKNAGVLTGITGMRAP